VDLNSPELTQTLKRLGEQAWMVREKAYTFGVKVGAAACSESGDIFVGCNVEHQFRCHDVHAEVNAITNMISAGHTKLTAIVIAADLKLFTPCGSCMDWIMQFGGKLCVVAYQRERKGSLEIYRASDLMPFYPVR
jgi:cytidine deaminase